MDEITDDNEMQEQLELWAIETSAEIDGEIIIENDYEILFRVNKGEWRHGLPQNNGPSNPTRS